MSFFFFDYFGLNMTHFIIVVYIYLDSDLLRFGCVNYFIVLGWLRLFLKKTNPRRALSL